MIFLSKGSYGIIGPGKADSRPIMLVQMLPI